MLFTALAALAGVAAALEAPRTAIPVGVTVPNTLNVDDVRVLPAHGGVA